MFSILVVLLLLVKRKTVATSIHVRGRVDPPPETETDPEKTASNEEQDKGFAFFPATAAERLAAREAPTNPIVEEAKSLGQPWTPFVPHGIDLGASSMLTGNAFMVKPLNDRFRKYQRGE